MTLSELKVGTRLELEILNDVGIRTEPVLLSNVEEITDENNLIIAAPIFQGNIYPVSLGTFLTIYFVDKRKAISNRYKLNAIVKDRGINEKIKYLNVEKQGDIEKAQRRKYFRLECFIQVEYRVIESLDSDSNADIPFKKAVTNDLSGGGIGIMLDEKIDIGSLVECVIRADGNRKVNFYGSVKRYEENVLKGKYKHTAGIAYIKINEIDREAVIKFIFKEQRKMRRRGLI